MFEVKETALVYVYQPFISSYIIHEHVCKIGPDIDPLKRTTRWLAEDVNGYSFANTGLFHIEISNNPCTEHHSSLGMENGYISIWMHFEDNKDPKRIIEQFLKRQIYSVINEQKILHKLQNTLGLIFEDVALAKIV